MTLLPILLPEDSIVKVALGDKLKTGDVIAQNKGNSREEIIYLTKDYNISSDKFQKVLKKKLGDAVSDGEVIAQIPGVLGVSKSNILSKISGTIVKIDQDQGEVTIKGATSSDSSPILSPVDGTVEICNNQKIVIKTDSVVILAKDAIGKESQGELLHLSDLDSDKIASEVSDKVILLSSVDKLTLFKAIGLDASGVISENFDNIDFIELGDKKIKIAVMLVDGEDYKKLEKSKGKKVYLNTENKSIMIL